jgi:hypothetical protein
MAFKTIDIVEKVRNRVKPDCPDRLISKIDYLIITNIPEALQRVGRLFAASAEFNVLQVKFQGTPVLGLLDVDTMTSTVPGYTPEHILWNTISQTGSIRETTDTVNKRPFFRVPRRSAIYGKVTTLEDGVTWFPDGNRKIAFKDVDGKIPGETGSYANQVTLTVNVNPTLANLPTQCEELFISELTKIVGERGGALIAPEDDSSILDGERGRDVARITA